MYMYMYSTQICTNYIIIFIVLLSTKKHTVLRHFLSFINSLPRTSYILRYLVPIPATRHVGCPGNHANEEVPSADPTSKNFALASSELVE
jgi:hypothetical protein